MSTATDVPRNAAPDGAGADRAAPVQAAAVTRLTDDERLANQAWEALLSTQVRLMRTFAEEDVWQPLSIREYDVLYTLRKGPAHGLRLRELNEGVYLSQPSLSRMVERMAERGLVSRSAAPDDGRGVLVALTPEGRRLQREIGSRHARSVSAHVGGALDPDDLRELTRLCEILVAHQASPTTTPRTKASTS